MNDTMPVDLGAAIATGPMWLQVWVLTLVVAHLSAILFAATKQNGKLRVRTEAIAIVLSFLASGIFMSWLYDQVGYVRLLGLPHLIFWLPVYIWLLRKYPRNEFSFPFKQYIIVYFVIAGISLIIDVTDATRYLLGEQQPLHITNEFADHHVKYRLVS